MPATVVFAGPSIHGLDRKELRGFQLKPPAKCGDLYRAARGGASAIGLIDGIFGSAPSVWHKEILFALSAGLRVYGAASMGALRAAECAPYGMIGLGAIFRSYLDGSRVADADVAVLHAPAELAFKPLTLALVDADASIERLRRLGRISPAEQDALQQSAAALHFSERTWDRVVEALRACPRRKRSLTTAMKVRGQSLKSDDARALLQRMRRDAARAVPAAAPLWALQESASFDVLETYR